MSLPSPWLPNGLADPAASKTSSLGSSWISKHEPTSSQSFTIFPKFAKCCEPSEGRPRVQLERCYDHRGAVTQVHTHWSQALLLFHKILIQVGKFELDVASASFGSWAWGVRWQQLLDLGKICESKSSVFCNGFRQVGEGETNSVPQWPSRFCVARHLLGSSRGTRLKPEGSLLAFLPNQTTREHGSGTILQGTMLVKWDKLFATLVPIKVACHLDGRRRTAVQGWVCLTNYNFVKYERYRSLTSY